MHPFRNYSNFLTERYGEKTYKLTLAGGKTCPTRDGTFGPRKGWGGCSFCDQYGSASFFSNLRREQSVQTQLQEMSLAIRKRYRANKFIAYFQSYTTTYQEIAECQANYEAAIRFPGVVALSVATRPDCLPNEMIDALCTYLDKVDVQLELGVQSFHEPTLTWYERGHNVDCAIDAIHRVNHVLQKYSNRTHKFDLVIHLIIGAPTETDADLIAAARTLNTLNVHGVKIHHLHVLKRTKLAQRFAKEEFKLLNLEEYLAKAALFLRHLQPNIVVHRTHGTVSHPDLLVGPSWSLQKIHPAQRLRDFMLQNGWQQGDLIAH